MKKLSPFKIILIILSIVLIIGLVLYYSGSDSANTATTEDSSAKDAPLMTDTPEQTTKTPSENDSSPTDTTGRYTEYSEEAVTSESYETTVLFFHAPWCPECRAFEQVILAGTVPSNTQILKVDYDSNKDLRAKYGVTIQTTFVRVSASGEKQKLWTGYGASKSIDAIIENTK